MTEEKKQEVATQEKSEGQLMKTQGRGLNNQNYDTSDLIIPRAKLCQAMTPEVIERPKDFSPGMIIDNLELTELPSEFIPISQSKNWIRFNPRKKSDNGFDPAYEPGALIWSSDDPLDPKVVEQSKWGADGEPPLATGFLNFFGYFVGHYTPVVVSFSKTSYKAGKKLLSLAVFSGGDLFSRKYKITSKQTTQDGNTFFIYDVAPAGVVSEDEFKICEDWYNMFQSRNIKIHDEESMGEDDIAKGDKEDQQNWSE